MLKNHILARKHNGYGVGWGVDTWLAGGENTGGLSRVNNRKQLFHNGYQRLLIKRRHRSEIREMGFGRGIEI